VAITPHQALAITGRYKGSEDQQNLRVWDVESGEVLYCFPVPAHCAAFSPDGKRIVAGSGRVTVGSIHLSDPYLPVWELDSGRELGRYSGMPGQVGQVAFGWRDREVIATDYGPSINVWRVPGEKVDHRFSTNLGGGYDRIVFSRDGRCALTDCQHDICLWDVDSGEKLNTYRLEDYARPRGRDISRYRIDNKGFLPDGKHALFGIAHEKLTEDKPPPQRERGRPFDPGYHVSLLDYTLVICDLKTGKELHRSAIQDYYLTYLAVSGNGRRALYARFNKLQVWELPTP
jgi:WD40 repeat protein